MVAAGLGLGAVSVVFTLLGIWLQWRWNTAERTQMTAVMTRQRAVIADIMELKRNYEAAVEGRVAALQVALRDARMSIALASQLLSSLGR